MLICNNKGSTLSVALMLVFLVFAVTTLCLGRVASSYARIRMNQGETAALFLAEAGIRKAAVKLSYDRSYKGEKATRLDTGVFDVTVVRAGNRLKVRSTGFADSPFKKKPKKTIEAAVAFSGPGRFRIIDWKEDP